MTLSVTTDRQTILAAIVQWFETYSGLGTGKVIWANQKTPRLAKPYATLRITGQGIKTGFDETRPQFNGTSSAIERTYTGPRQLVVQCDVYTDPATAPGQLEAVDYLENALLSLETQPVRDLLRTAKLGHLTEGTMMRLDEQLGDRWERRAEVDVTFTYSGEMFDDGLTGESGNWIETVEAPTEDNGNATWSE